MSVLEYGRVRVASSASMGTTVPDAAVPEAAGRYSWEYASRAGFAGQVYTVVGRRLTVDDDPALRLVILSALAARLPEDAQASSYALESSDVAAALEEAQMAAFAALEEDDAS